VFNKLDLILRRPRSGRLEEAAIPICDSRYRLQAKGIEVQEENKKSMKEDVE